MAHRRPSIRLSVSSRPKALKAPGYITGAVSASFLWIMLLLVVLGAAFFAWQSLRYVPAADGSGIRLSNLQLEHHERKLLLSADASITLPATVEAGLDNGVPLTFVLSFSVIEPRVWWFDRTILEVQRRYTLTYYELTRHFRVSALETDVNRNFRSLSSALAGLGELDRTSFDLNEQQLGSMAREGLVGKLDMSLLQSALPLPLQPIIRSSWTLQSPEYRWPVT